MLQNQVSFNEELEPVYLELGKALIVCQAFEGTLVMLLSTISYEEAGMQDGSFDAAIDLFSQKTLGQLLKHLKERLDIPSELDEHLRSAWANRNWIVHEFLHRMALDIYLPKGRLVAIARLAEAKRKVKFADIAANRVLDLYLEKYELSVDSLKANADRMWELMNRPPSPLAN